MLILVGAALAGSCGAAKSPAVSEPAADAPSSGVHSRELRRIMRRMRSLTFSRMPQELGDDAGTRLSPGRAASIASDLSSAADEIVMAAPRLKLSSDEQADFIAEAESLRAHAAALETSAASGDGPAADQAFAEIKGSCNHCHARFRDAW